ncbi:transposase DNA-binding-containing protein [Bradymonas sediminis]|uniref:Uncharacterized protein n=1 Tax=Bradymonas sediminis TaxID=1548548 RepID=A0A2Z4FH87_9DELT|nr:hypothetical protein DN745_01695 [Bradymonas sediminis]TDP77236.1 transposase-like DNA-binding protein [Bradymonas sediminis]
MQQVTEILADISLSEEVADAPLGDVRRSQRFARIMESLGRQPEASIPEAMGGSSASGGVLSVDAKRGGRSLQVA